MERAIALYEDGETDLPLGNFKSRSGNPGGRGRGNGFGRGHGNGFGQGKFNRTNATGGRDR